MDVPMTTVCPHCETEHSHATIGYIKGEKREAPRENDLTICVSCGGWSVFNRQGQLRTPDRKEKIFIESDVNAQRMHTAWALNQLRHEKRSTRH